MSNLLQELSTQGLLLLYLADELSPEDRAEVERQMLRDPAVRAELESLREWQERVQSGLASLDAATPLAAAEAAAVRNVSRVLRQRQARPRVAASAGASDSAPRRLPRWAYPAAVAAAIALLAGATWKTLGPGPRDRLVQRPVPDEVDPQRGQGDSEAVQPVLLDPWENDVVQALSREVMDTPPSDVHEVASGGYDQPLFDFPFDVSQEGGPAEQ